MNTTQKTANQVQVGDFIQQSSGLAFNDVAFYEVIRIRKTKEFRGVFITTKKANNREIEFRYDKTKKLFTK